MFARISVVAACVLGLAGLAVAQPAALSPLKPGPVKAPTATATAATPAPPAGHALTAEDLGAFLDGFMPMAIARGDIAGAEVVVVKDGQVLFEKGYGVSDVDKQTPVDPKTTLFRPGSISKLFTWTAVMQLVGEHKLNLDADVNPYLDFKIPEAYGKPVTLRDLMTHTPGFEETIKHLFVSDPKARLDLRGAVSDWVPDRIFAPGNTPAYSNYGASLAGYIVQRVSGERFEDYVAHHIFQPLGMNHSSFDQPLPKSLIGDMSKGYQTASDKPSPFEGIPMSPAGALSASGDDMARFMIAHLNNGSYNGAQILPPQVAHEMHDTLYQRTPPAPGIALGFYHVDRNGHTVLSHGGDTIAFHSDLMLVMDQNVGLYVSQNSAGKPGSSFRWPLYVEFMDRYFPGAPPPKDEPTLKTAKTDGALAVGTYESSRRSQSNFFSIASMLSQAKVTLNADDTISFDEEKNFAGDPKKWREVKPFVWREVHGGALLIATVKDGAVTELTSTDTPQIWVISRPPFRRGGWNLPLFIATYAMLTLTVLFWPVKAVLRWRYGKPFPLEGGAARLYQLTRLTALLDVAFIAGYAALIQYGTTHLEVFGDAGDKWLRILQFVGLLGVIAVVFPIAEVFTAFTDGAERPWWTKLTDVLVALAAVASIWFAFSLHLLSWHLNY